MSTCILSLEEFVSSVFLSSVFSSSVRVCEFVVVASVSMSGVCAGLWSPCRTGSLFKMVALSRRPIYLLISAPVNFLRRTSNCKRRWKSAGEKEEKESLPRLPLVLSRHSSAVIFPRKGHSPFDPDGKREEE